MPSSIYTNTGIVDASWNSRGLILHNAVNKNLLRQDNGTLWAAVREGHPNKYINIYKSSDDGFSWQRMFSGTFDSVNRKTGITNINVNGPVMHLTLNEELNRLILWHAFYEVAYGRFDIESFVFNITENGLVRPPTSGDGADPTVSKTIVTDQDELAFDVAHTNNGVWLTYTFSSKITTQFYRHSEQTQADGGTYSTVINDFFPYVATHADDDETLNIISVRDLGSTYSLVHIKYDRLSATYSSPVTIVNFAAADISDLNLGKDAYGTLCAYWSQKNEAETSVDPYYALSYDDGQSWTNSIRIPSTLGQGYFRDGATNQLSARTTMLAGLQGFIFSYVRNHDDNISNHAKSYVRRLTTEDGIFYSLEDEKTAASRQDDDVIGLNFFRPSAGSLIDLSQPGEIRVAYSVGNSTSTIQVDKRPSYFGQKLLKDEAYPEVTIVEYSSDEPLENQLLFSFNLLGSVDSNVDYYAEGLIGPITNKYLTAFNRFGTSVQLTKYTPIAESQMSDKSAYEYSEGWYTKAFVQDVNYGFPNPMGNESFETYIERDARKIHLPPDFHLDRTFLVNKGNHLKRTVWIMNFGGNEYELSQVVPKFIDNQIAYYVSNAYVVGPSRNPFSRTILPSET